MNMELSSKTRYNEKKELCSEIVKKNTRDYARKMDLDNKHNFVASDPANYDIFGFSESMDNCSWGRLIEVHSGATKCRKRAAKYKKLAKSRKLHFVRKSKLEKVLKQSF